MKTYSLYNLVTGEFDGRTTSCPVSQLQANGPPPGFGMREGTFDRDTQRVDVATDEVVDFVRTRSAFEIEELDSTIHRRINDLEQEQKLIERQARRSGQTVQQLSRLAEIAASVEGELDKLGAKRLVGR
jgi:hypothetical protein